MKLGDLLKIINDVQIKKKTSPVFICGGMCRDKVLKQLDKVEDLDLTTGDQSIHYLAKEVSIALAKKYNITTKVGDDGHSSIYLNNFKLDFSSNFNTPNIDEILKNMKIKNPTPMEKELYSRDFTCNALLMTLDLKTIIDPTNRGVNDIQEKMIRTCLAPEITLTSNKNRVVRAIYLAAKLDFDVDVNIINWVRKHPTSIRLSSDKALSEKLNKAMSYNPNKTVHLLDQMDLWEQIPITTALHPYYMKRLVNK